MNSTYNKLLKTLITAALKSGKILESYFLKRQFNLASKPGAGLVTSADIEAEEAALKILNKAQPGFGVIAEETGIKNKNSSGVWIIDPLDGTTNFVHGFPMFCFTAAACIENKVVAGVIYHPIFKHLYTCTLGGGSTLNNKKILVSKTQKISDSLLTTGFAYQKSDSLKKEIQTFERVSQIARAVRRPGSAAMDLAYVAQGVFDGFWERNLSPWDVAAGSLLITEAGGKVSQYRGQSFDVFSKEILATNGRLHTSMIKTLA